MYFWRLEELKARIAVTSLSEREALPYFVVFSALMTAGMTIPLPDRNLWDALGSTWSVVLAVAGTLYCYQRNGGTDGHHFLQRFLAVGWVVSVRFIPLFVLLAFGVIEFDGGFDATTQSTTWQQFVFFALVETFLYWMIGHHIADVAKRSGTT